MLKNVPAAGLDIRMYQAAYIMWAVKSGVPVIVIDGEYQFSTMRATFKHWVSIADRGIGKPCRMTNIERLVELWSPYQRRVWPRQSVMFYVYCPERELPLNENDDEMEFTFGYVGNDYQRQEYLAKFYKRQLNDGTYLNNAVWGNWRPDEKMYVESRLDEIVGRDAFKGRVPPSQIHACYCRCAASIVIAHRKYYAAGMLTQRFSEVIEAGRLLFVDSQLKGIDALGLEDYAVATPEGAHRNLMAVIEEGSYWDHVAWQRERLRTNPRLTAGFWVDGMERVAARTAPLSLTAPRW